MNDPLPRSTTRMDADALYFVSLGGAGEIGMNLSLYGAAGDWLIVDCGVTFGDDSQPGVDVVMPDPAFIVERRERLLGIVATHAHEDHIGAIPYLWRQLRCPVWATPFTAALLRAKLVEAGLAQEVRINIVPMSGRFSIGPFDLELITLTHSIPEPNAVVLRTAAGTVLHTGDWKFDPDPLVGPTADEAALRRIGDDGVLAMICDSTNALRPGTSGSEAELRASLVDLVGRYDARVAVACFASNVARLETIAYAAAAHGRDVALVGRSLWRIDKAARETGYLRDVPRFLTDDEAGYIPRDRILLICTGSQGEPRSALARIARGDHPNVVLEEGDAVIFSSRIIPGNEKSIGRLQNALAQMRIEIVTELDHFVHVSGHPAQDELVHMYQLVRPQIAIPVHGEARHLLAHARLAADCQVPQPLLIENGDLVRLGSGKAEIVDEVPVGRLASDGKSLLPLGGEALKERRRVTLNGAAVASLVLDRQGGLAAPPAISAIGLVESEAAAAAAPHLRGAVERAIDELPAARRRDDDMVRDAVRRALRRVFNERFGKRPLIEIQPDPPRRRGAMIGRLNHVAIVVPDLAAASAVYREALGARVSEPQALPAHGVTVAFVELPNAKIELLEPLGDASPVAIFLQRNPSGGMHHLCCEVDDIIAARDRLQRAGARILGDGEPRPGAHGKPVLFLHPKDFCGTLIELEET